MSNTRSSSKPQRRCCHGEDSRDCLLKAATRLFAKLGFGATTVRDIADEAGVNLSLVSYYFNGKDGLYSAVIEQFGRQRLAVAKRILQPPSNLEELRVRIQTMIEEMFSVHAEQREITSIVMREADKGLPHARKEFESTFLDIFNASVEFFKSAQKNGLVRKDVDPFFIASFIQMSLMSFFRMDAIGKHYYGFTLEDPKYRKKVAEDMLRIVLGGITERK
jgi:AcrR family transcriptional regulator